MFRHLTGHCQAVLTTFILEEPDDDLLKAKTCSLYCKKSNFTDNILNCFDLFSFD